RTDLQLDLLAFLKRKFKETNRVSLERIVSKPGIVNVLEFLCDKYPDMVNQSTLDQVAASPDKAQAIALLASRDRLCYKAMEIFVWTFGSEVGCAALKWLPYGGLYITGGTASHNVQRLRSDSTFMDAYYDKGRVNPLMRQVPVKVVVATDLCLRGVMVVAYRIFQERLRRKTFKPILVPRAAVYSAITIAFVAYAVRYRWGGFTFMRRVGW
ncbi:glucokinase, partial [Sphaeroforma arctica JP610]